MPSNLYSPSSPSSPIKKKKDSAKKQKNYKIHYNNS